MTKEEIKKSLLLCSDPDLSCKDCLYHSEYVRCNEALSADARDLIIKQEQEIEQLKEEKKQAQIDVLNKLKTNLLKSDDFMDICSWHIDKIIKEVEK